MIRNPTENEMQDLRRVEQWLYRNGDVPNDMAIVNAVTVCMLEWSRETANGMYTFAQVWIEKAEEIVATAKGL